MGAFIHRLVGFSMDKRRDLWTRFIDGCDASNAEKSPAGQGG